MSGRIERGPMTTTIFLVRHVRHEKQGVVAVGQAQGVRLGPAADAELSAVAARLAHERLDAVFASPVERAARTAVAIAQPHGIEPVLDEDLSELGFGDWTGRSFADLDADPAFRGWNERRSLHRPPGGESMLEAQARMVAALDRARAAHPEGRVALVGHGDPLKALVLYLLGMPIDFHDRIELEPASVTTAVVGDWGAKLITLNERVAP